ncbi:hypothetical protein G9A89_020384 [Geosiphon pyriformis]|nr:hypothetical protein G9A89_020384 [Geosiphon pyriformis]
MHHSQNRDATLIIGKQITITNSSGTHTVIRPKKTTTRREKIGGKMDKYLLESITAVILSPSSTIGKNIQEILSINKNLSYGRQLELYSRFGEIIEDMKLMKNFRNTILTIARRARTLIQRFGLLDMKLILSQVLSTLSTKNFNKLVEKQDNWNGATAGESKSMETNNNMANNNTWKIGTINVRGLNNPGKAEEVLQWIKDEQFDFVVITETKLTPEYHAFWESSTEKQMGTGVNILVRKCWTHHVEVIRIGLYMPASKSPTKKTVAKEIRKLIADIVQNKKIVIVADNTWTANGVQRRLDYVFTDVITALLVTNIGVINVNKSFSTDHKAVMWLTIKETVLQAAECLPKRKVGAQSAHTKKECINHKLVKIVTDIIKQIRVNNADMHNNNVMQLLAK